MTTHPCKVCGRPVPRLDTDTDAVYRVRRCCSQACRDVQRAEGARRGNIVRNRMPRETRTPEAVHAARVAELTASQREALSAFVRLIGFVRDEGRRMERIGLEPLYADGVQEALLIVGQHERGNRAKSNRTWRAS